MRIFEDLSPDIYPTLLEAFADALQRADLPQEGKWQLMHYEGGAKARLGLQGSRQELSLYRLVDISGTLERVSIVVRQNGPDDKPYEQRPHTKSWLNKPKRLDTPLYCSFKTNFYPT